MNRSPNPKNPNFDRIYEAAIKAGTREANSEIPPLMLVTDIHEMQKKDAQGQVGGIWFVQDGPIGYADIIIRPSRSAFCRWLLERGLACKHPHGGVEYSSTTVLKSQSYHRAFAFANAFASYLMGAGLGITVRVKSGMD